MIKGGMGHTELRDSVAFQAGQAEERRRVYELIRERIRLFRELQGRNADTYRHHAHETVVNELLLVCRVLDGEL